MTNHTNTKRIVPFSFKTYIVIQKKNYGTEFCVKCQKFFCFCIESQMIHTNRNTTNALPSSDGLDLYCYETMPES